MSAPLVGRSDPTEGRDHLPARSVRGRIIDFLAAHIWACICTWMAQNRDRRALARASDRLLKDIGVSREAVSLDTYNGFWRVKFPAHENF
jgi:uncharacterized protein YjiS (DUF1127 family)